MRFIVLAAFIAVPIAEIATFITLGGWIGLWPTVGCIILTAVIGVALLRAQGLATLKQARAAADKGEVPVTAVVHGIFLLIAGALLLTPGFITDSVGFILLVPSIRLAIAKAVWSRIKGSDNVDIVIDGDYREHPGGVKDPGPRPGSPGDRPVIGDTIEGTAVENPASPWSDKKPPKPGPPDAPGDGKTDNGRKP